MQMRRIRVGIDVGGTFTKAVAIDMIKGGIIGKVTVPTTHSSGEGVSTGIVQALKSLMEKYHIKRVPVMRGKKVVGMVTRSNLMHAMVSLARAEPKSAKNDAAIREALLAEMQKESWAPAAMVNVVVRDGVVELWGVIIDDRQREAILHRAARIEGFDLRVARHVLRREAVQADHRGAADGIEDAVVDHRETPGVGA